ncbi:MAG: hypothetical protein ABR592_08280 [Nitriliruptorales bacterium]
MTVAALYGGSAPHHQALHGEPAGPWIDEVIYLPHATNADLSHHQFLLVPERLHRGLLHLAAPIVMDFLGSGGTVVAFGGQPTGWLPGLHWEHRPTNFWWWREPEGRSGLVARDPDHPFFRHVPLRDATWHFHGVFHPSPGAETILASDVGGAVLYIDEASTGGTLIVTSLDPLYHVGSYFMPAAGRFLAGFLPWLLGPRPGP